MGMGRSVAGAVGTVALYGMVRSFGPWRTLLILFLIVAVPAGALGGAAAYATYLNKEAQADSLVKVQGLSNKQAHKTYKAGGMITVRGKHLDRIDSVTVGGMAASITEKSGKEMTVRIPTMIKTGHYKLGATAGQLSFESKRKLNVREDKSYETRPFAWLDVFSQ